MSINLDDLNEDPRRGLGELASRPESLSQQRAFHNYILNEQSQALPNESNNITLLTLGQLFKGDVNAEKAIHSSSKEENKYLIQAMKILNANLGDDVFFTNTPAGNTKKAGYSALQEKFGKDFTGAVNLSALLKNREAEMRFNEIINPVIEDTETSFLRRTGALKDMPIIPQR